MKTAHFLSFSLLLLLLSGVVGLGFSQVQAQSLTSPQPAIVPAPVVASPISNPNALAVAPDSVTLSAIPPRLGDEGNLKAKPGEKIQAVIRVRNSSQQAMTIQTTAQDFIIGEDGQTPLPVSSNVSNRWSLASWMMISPETQTVGSLQTAQVNVIIDVPPDALPGGHYAMIMHQPATGGVGANGEPIAAETASAISQRVGTLVYFLVEGPINEEAFIRNINFPSLTEYGPVPFSFTVENVSDVHIRPQVTVDIYNLFGQKVDTLIVEQKNVFPFVSRDFEGQWDRVWGIGPYTAKFTMSFGSQGKVALAKTSFWLIPYTLVAGIGIAILVLLTLILVIRRYVIHHRAGEQTRIKMLEEKLAELESEKNRHHEE
jgi:hypothetical protein